MYVYLYTLCSYIDVPVVLFSRILFLLKFSQLKMGSLPQGQQLWLVVYCGRRNLEEHHIWQFQNWSISENKIMVFKFEIFNSILLLFQPLRTQSALTTVCFHGSCDWGHLLPHQFSNFQNSYTADLSNIMITYLSYILLVFMALGMSFFI